MSKPDETELSCEGCENGKIVNYSISCPHIGNSDSTIGIGWAKILATICKHYTEPEPSELDKAYSQFFSEHAHEQPTSRHDFRAGWQALWRMVTKWGSECPDDTRLAMRAFRDFLDKLNAEVVE